MRAARLLKIPLFILCEMCYTKISYSINKGEAFIRKSVLPLAAV